MTRGASSRGVRLGLKENWRQFAMLVLVNAFVGGMVGIERTVVPLVGSEEFGLVLRTAIFSFIGSFGVVKACSNLVSGVSRQVRQEEGADRRLVDRCAVTAKPVEAFLAKQMRSPSRPP